QMYLQGIRVGMYPEGANAATTHSLSRHIQGGRCKLSWAETFEMGKPSLPRLVPCVLLLAFTSYLLNCQAAPKDPNTPSDPTPTPPVQQKVASVKGVLMWKGDPSETGTYSTETTLTPANVN